MTDLIRTPDCELVLDMPGQPERVRVNRHNLVADDGLWIAFYNMSGEVPGPEEFGPNHPMPWDEGKPPKKRPRLLAANADLSTAPVSARLGLAPLKTKYGKPGLFFCDTRMDTTGFVTHFAIGNRKEGMLVAGQFNEPFATRQGNGLNFGIRLEDAAPLKHRFPVLPPLIDPVNNPLRQCTVYTCMECGVIEIEHIQTHDARRGPWFHWASNGKRHEVERTQPWEELPGGRQS